LIPEETNSIVFEDLSVSFEPVHHGDVAILHNFSVQELWMFDVKILIPLVVVVPVILIFWLFWKRRKIKP